jgi:carbon storage regulator
MLVLSRCKDQSIMVGQTIQLTIVDVRGKRVRIGITAPRSIPVHRKEVYDAIHRQKIDKTK